MEEVTLVAPPEEELLDEELELLDEDDELELLEEPEPLEEELELLDEEDDDELELLEEDDELELLDDEESVLSLLPHAARIRQLTNAATVSPRSTNFLLAMLYYPPD